MDEAEKMRRAKRAGWNEKDGLPPYEHGEFVEGLDAVTDINEIDKLK